MLLEPPVSPTSLTGAHSPVPETLQRDTRAHQKSRVQQHKNLWDHHGTHQSPRELHRGWVPECGAGRTKPATGAKFWWIRRTQITRAAENLQSPWTKWVARDPAGIPAPPWPSELQSPWSLQQPGAHPVQPELTWAPAGPGSGLMAQHTPGPPPSITMAQLCTQSGQAPTH